MVKRIWATGCSHTQGGGLQSQQSRTWYSKHNIHYNDITEVSYVRWLSDILKLEWINTAKSGTGLKRLLRKTWEYINEVGLEKTKETFFILQINNPLVRMEFWCNDLNRYLVVNTRWDDKGNLEWIESKDDHPIASRDKSYFENHTHHIKHYIENYYDLKGEYDKLGMGLVGLISFFELNNIKYMIEGTDTFILSYLERFIPQYKKHLINIEGFTALNIWAYKNKSLIEDETEGYSKDNHAGIFAQKIWASKLNEFIKQNELLNN